MQPGLAYVPWAQMRQCNSITMLYRMQSERLPIYRQFADQLVKSDGAYPCFCSQARLQALSSGSPTQSGYDRHCRNLSERQIQGKLKTGAPYTIRLKVRNVAWPAYWVCAHSLFSIAPPSPPPLPHTTISWTHTLRKCYHISMFSGTTNR